MPTAGTSEPRHVRPLVSDLWHRGIGGLIVAIHATVFVASLAGPGLVLIGTFIDDGRFSLSAWANVFADWGRWGTLLSNTAIVSITTLAVLMTVGVALAACLFKTDARGRFVGISLLLLAAAIPLYVVDGAAIAIFGADSLRGSAPAVGLIHALAHLPLVVIIIGMAFRSVPPAAEESALVDGAGRWGTFRHVTLRMGFGGLAAAAIIVLLWVTTDYSVSDTLLVRTFAEEVYTQYALEGRPQEPALVCLPQMLLFGVVLWMLRRHYLTGTDAPPPVTATFQFKTRRWRPLLSFVALGIPLILVGTLLSALVSPLRESPEPLHVASWFVEEVSTSLVTGGLAGSISAALGVGLAWYIVRRPRWRPILAAYVVAMLAIPAPILGIGMILLFNRPGIMGNLYDSPAILTVAYIFRFLPLAVIFLIPSVRALPCDCEHAARVDGCSELGVWLRIVWPQCLRTVLVTAFVILVLAVGELPCSLLVTPPGSVTVGARLFSLLHYGMYPDAAMLCLLSIAGIIIPSCILLLLLKPRLTG